MGDVVVALTLDQRHIVAIGTAAMVNKDKMVVTSGEGSSQSFPRSAHVILKVAAVRFA
jgi:hypothetical protein